MNFSYIVQGPAREDPVASVPCDLDESWTNFETELGKFKTEFASARAELTRLSHILGHKNEDLYSMRIMLDTVHSPGLKDKLLDIVDKYESDEGIDALTLQYGEAAGKVEAMKKVLMDTNAERYARFTCFVCIDRLVDVFIEPCGHVMCELCWVRTQNKEVCPGCRTACGGVKRIYSMT